VEKDLEVVNDLKDFEVVNDLKDFEILYPKNQDFQSFDFFYS